MTYNSQPEENNLDPHTPEEQEQLDPILKQRTDIETENAPLPPQRNYLREALNRIQSMFHSTREKPSAAETIPPSESEAALPDSSLPETAELPTDELELLTLRLGGSILPEEEPQAVPSETPIEDDFSLLADTDDDRLLPVNLLLDEEETPGYPVEDTAPVSRLIDETRPPANGFGQWEEESETPRAEEDSWAPIFNTRDQKPEPEISETSQKEFEDFLNRLNAIRTQPAEAAPPPPPISPEDQSPDYSPIYTRQLGLEEETAPGVENPEISSTEEDNTISPALLSRLFPESQAKEPSAEIPESGMFSSTFSLQAPNTRILGKELDELEGSPERAAPPTPHTTNTQMLTFEFEEESLPENNPKDNERDLRIDLSEESSPISEFGTHQWAFEDEELPPGRPGISTRELNLDIDEETSPSAGMISQYDTKKLNPEDVENPEDNTSSSPAFILDSPEELFNPEGGADNKEAFPTWDELRSVMDLPPQPTVSSPTQPFDLGSWLQKLKTGGLKEPQKRPIEEITPPAPPPPPPPPEVIPMPSEKYQDEEEFIDRLEYLSKGEFTEYGSFEIEEVEEEIIPTVLSYPEEEVEPSAVNAEEEENRLRNILLSGRGMEGENPLLPSGNAASKPNFTAISYLQALPKQLQKWYTELSTGQRIFTILIIFFSLLLLAGSIAVGWLIGQDLRPPEAYVGNTSVLPVSVQFPGGWSFRLSPGHIINGVWEPKTAEWLPDSEIRRVIVLPSSRYLQAVAHTLQRGDSILLLMDNKDVLTYHFEYMEQVSRTNTSYLDGNDPALILILSEPDSDQRWIIFCTP